MFYIQVPDIDVSILDIEDSAIARLIHFATYATLSDRPTYVEYLKNSTLLDYAGFLCLRTHASLTDNSTLKEIIIKGECRLIKERLRLLRPNFLRKYLIKTIEDIKLFNNTDDNINVLLKICSEYKDNHHIPCDEQCSLKSIEVPWQKCPTLVSELKVHLVQGIAIVPCNQWNSLLIDMFQLIYNKTLFHIRRAMSALSENSLQVEYLSEQINKYYYSEIVSWKNANEVMNLEELNLQKKCLPPCMLLSLNSLFNNHRLAHDPRYRLTLFLKEIGVPMDQTLLLFKQEYSKFGSLESTCTHTWENHYQQIEYNVKHTYGMVGSKKIYQMTPCAKMQKQNIQVYDEGGCPFVHCNENKLKSILEEYTSISDLEMNIINDFKDSDEPVRACHWYANKLSQMSKPLIHDTPSQYFFNLKNIRSVPK